MDSYAIAAKHYDAAYAAKKDLIDIPYYLELAERIGGPVLEIGCGTGRILLEAARRGVEIEGLDMSQAQLEVLRRKLKALPAAVQERVRGLHLADMRSFSLPRRFNLITIPFRPLQHLYTVDQQIAAFNRVREHLAPNGRFAFDVFYPLYSALDENLGVEVPELEWCDPDNPGRIVKRSFIRRSVNRLEQYFTGELIFRSYQGGELLHEEREGLKMSYYTYPHLQLLFRHCGFSPVEEYGSFTRDPISVCRDMIFVLECA